MWVSNLALNNFRSYQDLVTELPKGVVVLQGQNGQGKTNLLEAIAYLSAFSSHRVSADSALMRKPADGQEVRAAVVRAKVETHRRTYVMDLELVRGSANRARLNRAKVAPRDLLGILRTVVFAPEDLQLLRGEPTLRRQFMDNVITELHPVFVSTRAELKQILAQRAATLKQLRTNNWGVQATTDFLEVWDEQLAQKSALAAILRQAVCTQLNAALTTTYSQVSQDGRQVSLSYKMAQTRIQAAVVAAAQMVRIEQGVLQADLAQLVGEIAPLYLTEIQEKRKKEIERGQNLVGAHLDDLEFKLDHLPVKGYASHGETWSVALGMRLAQANVLTMPDDVPVMILDDVFAELDSARRQALAAQLEAFDQVLITAAVPADVPDDLLAKRLKVTKNAQGISQVEAV